MNPRDWLDTARTHLWHLRTGGIAQWREHRRRRRVASPFARVASLVRDSGGSLAFTPWAWPDAEPRRDLRVAVIGDAFTAAAFRYEWRMVPITPSDWLHHLDAEPVDLLFVESAWAGNDGAWRYHLTGPSAPRPAVVDLVEECRTRGVPTVFWNKEDPVHLEDFLDTARLFDQVFTTDADCVPTYRERLGHDRVGVLPFAVPDRVTNPVRVTRDHQPRGVAFAGTWFAHKYPERREQMRLLFDATLAAAPAAGFDIFSRFLGGDERYQFPAPYAAHVRGSLPYDQMLSAYRSYQVFLNVNTVTSSPTMCARRALEITACGTPVVSTPSPALATFLGEGVVQVSEPEQATQAIAALLADEHARARLVHRGQRELWRAHTYSHRVDTVLDAVGLPHQPVRLPSVSLLVPTNRPHQVDHVLTSATRQVDCEVELLIATHGFTAPDDLLARARAAGLEHVTLVPMPTRASLGECLNALLDRAGGEVVSKMDDDDFYAPDYLADLLRALRYTGADIVGKHARYVYLGGPDVTVLARGMNEHCRTHFVAGPTLTVTAEAARMLRFAPLTRGEDSDFLRRALEAGLRIHATDRFNFVQYRSANPADHTWTGADEAFAAEPVLARGHATELATV